MSEIRICPITEDECLAQCAKEVPCFISESAAQITRPPTAKEIHKQSEMYSLSRHGSFEETKKIAEAIEETAQKLIAKSTPFVMSSETKVPVEGQIVGSNFYGTRFFERRGCGSSPEKCGASIQRKGKPVSCILTTPPQEYVFTVYKNSGVEREAIVGDVTCNSSEPSIIITSRG